MLIEIPAVGGTYKSRSNAVSNQVARNFYIEVNPETSEPLSLQPFPGLKPFATVNNGDGRGVRTYKDEVYVVSGNKLTKVAEDATVTEIGGISGSSRAVMDEDLSSLIIATAGQKPYQYDGTTLNQGSDVDLHTSNTVAYINRRVVYDGNGGDVIFADLSAPLTVSSDNVTIAESNSDNTICVWTHGSQLNVGGDKSIEPYYNSGSGNPPYSLITNAVQQIGVCAPYSIAKNKDFSYFLGSDLSVYRMSGLSSQAITPPPIAKAISEYPRCDDAFGFCFTFDAMRFYLISFPSGNETWLYNEISNSWTNLAYGVNGNQHLIGGYVYAYNKHLVMDRRNGDLYELDFDTFTDNGELIQRQRDTFSINGRSFGRPGKKLFMDRLELTIEPGNSQVSGEAVVMMSYSDDNGKSWSSERWAKVGLQGDYTYRLEWFSLGCFYSRMFRFRMTDPIRWVILSCKADVEVESG